ncbi:MAG TPA: alpha/beta hydrolase, partial [Thermomicrobiaceae bacterium]|nr:alpha/beta hydrolase [Thermomicrobiaceae bacterium]
MNERAPHSGFASVNGLSLYYEVHGVGEPLILLHGGVAGIPMLDPLIARLSGSRQVVAVELQGHGRSAGVDRPLAFEAMADDIAALVNQLGLAPADVFGLSLGGGVAL